MTAAIKIPLYCWQSQCLLPSDYIYGLCNGDAVYSAMTALNCNAMPSLDQVSSYGHCNSATKVTGPELKNLAFDAGQGQYFLTYSHHMHSSARAITPDECGRVNVTFHVLLLSGRSHDTLSASGEWIWMRCRESSPGHLARDLPVTLLSNLAYNHTTPTAVSLGIQKPRAFDHLKVVYEIRIYVWKGVFLHYLFHSRHFALLKLTSYMRHCTFHETYITTHLHISG